MFCDVQQSAAQVELEAAQQELTSAQASFESGTLRVDELMQTIHDRDAELQVMLSTFFLKHSLGRTRDLLATRSLDNKNIIRFLARRCCWTVLRLDCPGAACLSDRLRSTQVDVRWNRYVSVFKKCVVRRDLNRPGMWRMRIAALRRLLSPSMRCMRGAGVAIKSRCRGC